MTKAGWCFMALTAAAAGLFAYSEWKARRDRQEFDRQRKFMQDLERKIQERHVPLLPHMIDVATFTNGEPVSEETKAALGQVAVMVSTRVRCQVCGRPLINHASQQRGFGRHCHAKVKKLEAAPAIDTQEQEP